jgi:hypothetical protein
MDFRLTWPQTLLKGLMMTALLRFKLRFHHWAVAAVLGFVLALAALFLAVMIGKFNETAAQTAKERFAQIAEQRERHAPSDRSQRAAGLGAAGTRREFCRAVC